MESYSSREFALYFLVSLFSCFDHFIGVFCYLVGRPCFHVIMEFMDSHEELLLFFVVVDFFFK